MLDQLVWSLSRYLTLQIWLAGFCFTSVQVRLKLHSAGKHLKGWLTHSGHTQVTEGATDRKGVCLHDADVWVKAGEDNAAVPALLQDAGQDDVQEGVHVKVGRQILSPGAVLSTQSIALINTTLCIHKSSNCCWTGVRTLFWQIHLSSILKPTCSGTAWKICRQREGGTGGFLTYDWKNRCRKQEVRTNGVYLGEWREWLVLVHLVPLIQNLWTQKERKKNRKKIMIIAQFFHE